MNKLIKKKDDLKSSLPLMAIMCALSAIMVVFVTYLPVSSIIFTFLLPLPSIIIALYVHIKFYPIYFVSALTISLIAGVGDIGYALTSIIPSLIIALVIGIMIKKKCSMYFTLVVSSIFLFLLNLASICILNYLFNIKLISIVSEALQIKNNYDFLRLPIIYLYSLIQTFLILLVSLDQIKFLIKDEINKKSNCLIESIFSIVLSITSSVLFIYNYDFAFLFLIISLISCLYLITFKAKTLLKAIIFASTVVFTWIIYIIVLSYLKPVDSFIILNLIPVITSIFVLIYDLVFLIKSKKDLKL